MTEPFAAQHLAGARLHGAPRAAAPPDPGSPEAQAAEARLRAQDEERAERAIALAELIKRPEWAHVRTLLAEAFDDTLQAVFAGTAHIDAAKAVQDLATRLDQTLHLGQKAMERITERQFKGVSALEQHRQLRRGGVPAPGFLSHPLKPTVGPAPADSSR